MAIFVSTPGYLTVNTSGNNISVSDLGTGTLWVQGVTVWTAGPGAGAVTASNITANGAATLTVTTPASGDSMWILATTGAQTVYTQIMLFASAPQVVSPSFAGASGTAITTLSPQAGAAWVGSPAAGYNGTLATNGNGQAYKNANGTNGAQILSSNTVPGGACKASMLVYMPSNVAGEFAAISMADASGNQYVFGMSGAGGGWYFQYRSSTNTANTISATAPPSYTAGTLFLLTLTYTGSGSHTFTATIATTNTISTSFSGTSDTHYTPQSVGIFSTGGTPTTSTGQQFVELAALYTGLTVAAQATTVPDYAGTSALLVTTAATGGFGPYNYQFRRALAPGGVIGTYANVGPNSTSLTYLDTGVAASTEYSYEVVATDSSSNQGTGANVLLTTTTGNPTGEVQYLVSSNGNIIDSDNQAGFPATNIADDNLSTYWAASITGGGGTAQNNKWVGYLFDQPVVPTRYRFGWQNLTGIVYDIGLWLGDAQFQGATTGATGSFPSPTAFDTMPICYGTGATQYYYPGILWERVPTSPTANAAWRIIQPTNPTPSGGLLPTLNELEIFGAPTPGVNCRPVMPVISPTGGFYPSGTTVTITSLTTTAAIYYTTDGTTPDNTKTLYAGPFTVTPTGSTPLIVKAVAYDTTCQTNYSCTTDKFYTAQFLAQPYLPSGVWYDINRGIKIDAAAGGWFDDTTRTGKLIWLGTPYNTAYDTNAIGGTGNNYGMVMYSSVDAYNWKYETELLVDMGADLGATCTQIQRPHMLYNAANSNYVIWGHGLGGSSSSQCSVASTSGSNPFSGWSWVNMNLTLPSGPTAYNDCTLSIDPNTGNGYTLFTANGFLTWLCQLNAGFTGFSGTVTNLSATATGASMNGEGQRGPYWNAALSQFIIQQSNVIGYGPVNGWSLGVTATSGTFTLTYGGQTTSGLAYNSTPGQVQTALQGLSSIGAGNCLVTGSTLAAGVYTMVLQGALLGPITGSGAGLNGGAVFSVTAIIQDNQSFTSSSVTGPYAYAGKLFAGTPTGTVYNAQGTRIYQIPAVGDVWIADRWYFQGPFLNNTNSVVGALAYSGDNPQVQVSRGYMQYSLDYTIPAATLTGSSSGTVGNPITYTIGIPSSASTSIARYTGMAYPVSSVGGDTLSASSIPIVGASSYTFTLTPSTTGNRTVSVSFVFPITSPTPITLNATTGGGGGALADGNRNLDIGIGIGI